LQRRPADRDRVARIVNSRLLKSCAILLASTRELSSNYVGFSVSRFRAGSGALMSMNV
jgi:hypothetical protein